MTKTVNVVYGVDMSSRNPWVIGAFVNDRNASVEQDKMEKMYDDLHWSNNTVKLHYTIDELMNGIETGQKDYNGNMIYEGMTVKYNAICPMSDIPDEFIGRVVWKECSFLVDDGKDAYRLFSECNEWEIIY